MKTRLRFKIIAVLICLSLVGLLISQGYWLKGLYVSSKKSTWDNIEDAMRMADYMELFLRLDSLSNNNFHSQINPQFSFSQDTAWEKRKDSLSCTFRVDLHHHLLSSDKRLTLRPLEPCSVLFYHSCPHYTTYFQMVI